MEPKYKLITHFESMYMPNDTLMTTGDTVEECKDRYINWWKRYDKDEQHAVQVVNFTELYEDGRRVS